MKATPQGGFAMIEVLIAILVLGLGVIGAASMQLSAMRATRQSAFQTAAMQLAVEMADKMRSNDRQMRLADEDNPFLAVDFDSARDGTAPPERLCHAESCTAEELARFDIYEWKQRVKAALPAARAVICRDARPWDSEARAFAWTCHAGAGNNASLVIKLGWRDKEADERAQRLTTASFAPSIALTVRPSLQ